MKLLICEDESLILKINNAYVEDYCEKRNLKIDKIVLKHKIDLEEDRKELQGVDMAILDIDLQDSVSGLDVAQYLRKRNPYVILIFITKHKNYALDACELYSCGFLQKPLKEEEFNQVFTRALLMYNGFYATKMNRMVKLHNKVIVKERSICYIEKVNRIKEIRVTTDQQTYIFRSTLKEMEVRLSECFIRINRAVLINAYQIYQMVDGTVEMSNGTTFPIQPKIERQIEAICSQLNIYY